MTLLISTFAAVLTGIIWYRGLPDDKYNVKDLVFMFWGASLMWFVDAIFEYAQLGAEYFSPCPSDMINDSFLGFSVVAFALVIWFVKFIIQDPENKIRIMLRRKSHV
mgnify:FL=1